MMDNEQTEQTEEKAKTIQEEKSQVTDESPKNRVSTLPVLDEARQLQSEQIKVNAETRKLNAQRAELLAEERLSGRSMAGFIQQDKPDTDEEYTEKFKKGEVNPLADDGIK